MTARRGVLLLGLALAASAHAAPLVTGIHAHAPVTVETAARAGYGAIRLWDTATGWSSTQPYPAHWNFDRVNQFLAASERADLKVLWTLGNTPRWASARPSEKCAYGSGCAAEPADIQAWRRYVRTVATRYRGRVECYEPWNEVSFPTDPQFSSPGAGGSPGQFFSGSVEAMVRLARVAHEEIRKADPQACVLSPSFHPASGNWAEKFDRYLAAGGGAYMDVASQHFYFADQPEQTVPVIRAMRRVMQKHGLAHLPMWNTEVGVRFAAKVRDWPGLSAEELVYALMLRTYLLNAAEGVARVYWYAWDNRHMGLKTAALDSPRAVQAAQAAARLASTLDDVECRADGALWRCRGHVDAKPIEVVWLAGKNPARRTLRFAYPASRWGVTPTVFPAGRKVQLDARPIVVEGHP